MAPSTSSSRNKGVAGRDENKKSDDASEKPAYSQENVQHNMRVIYYSRTFLAIVGGMVAGVLGLTAFSGFLFYLFIMILVSGAIAAKTKFNVFSYFDSWQRITLDGIAAGFLSFVLFWTFAYDIVHIF
ncbi:unnamed protein product [Calypogeia fissa]